MAFFGSHSIRNISLVFLFDCSFSLCAMYEWSRLERERCAGANVRPSQNSVGGAKAFKVAATAVVFVGKRSRMGTASGKDD